MQNNTFSGLFVGQTVVTLRTVDSTNNYLKSKLANFAPLHEGTVILAEKQTAGRGQLTNKWHSEPGKNLTFSLLLKPSFLNISQQFLLNKAISIAINDVLVSIIGRAAKIKWPNDLYFADKKLGGVLIENIIQGNTWKHAIIGIGLNVNQTEFNPELKNAISLHKILQSDYDLEVLLSQICKAIEAWYLKLKAGKTKEVVQAYSTSLYRLNELHIYKANDTLFEGKILSVTETGLLDVDVKGKSHLFNTKEIEFII